MMTSVLVAGCKKQNSLIRQLPVFSPSPLAASPSLESKVSSKHQFGEIFLQRLCRSKVPEIRPAQGLFSRQSSGGFPIRRTRHPSPGPLRQYIDSGSFKRL